MAQHLPGYGQVANSLRDMEDVYKKPRIIFLNQMTGPLFRELAEDISREWAPSLLITGHPDTLRRAPITSLGILAAPKYQLCSYFSRIVSWIRYFVWALSCCWRLSSDAMLFLASNPPFLGMLGYLLKLLRGQHYIILVHDVYPDVLVRFGRLKDWGLIARLWRRMNRLVWENSDIVFTIGGRMAKSLERMFDPCKTVARQVVVVPNWADIDRIRPLKKSDNKFAIRYGQVDKLTVMYSGKLGQTHDIETILAAAEQLREYDSIHFMFIGEGPKMYVAEEAKRSHRLDNLTILPFQPEEVLSLSLPTADLAVVTVAKGAEDLMVPSKTYYSMAAGSALIGLCDFSSEVASIIRRHDCGFVVRPGDCAAMAKGIMDLLANKSEMEHYRANSRRAAELFYSRKNTSQYIAAVSAFGCLQET